MVPATQIPKGFAVTGKRRVFSCPGSEKMKHKTAYIYAVKWRMDRHQWSGEGGRYSCPLCASMRGDCGRCPAGSNEGDDFCNTWSSAPHHSNQKEVYNLLASKLEELEAIDDV